MEKRLGISRWTRRGAEGEGSYRITNIHVTTVLNGDFALFGCWSARQRSGHDILVHDIGFLDPRTDWFVDVTQGVDYDVNKTQRNDNTD